MSRKKTLISKIVLISIIATCLQNFAAIVSDNDGSTFVTKAEFNALKDSFASQIDNYNTSIDRKIDGAIASYLSGMQLQKTSQSDNLLYDILSNNSNYGFYNMTGNANFGLDHKIEFTGVNNFFCCYKNVFWSYRENYQGYVSTSKLKTGKGSLDALIPRYEIKGGHKIYQGCWNNFNIAYYLSDTNYYTGNSLWFGGVISNMDYSNNNLSVFAPSTQVAQRPYKFSATTIGFNYVGSGATSGYVKTGKYIPLLKNGHTTVATASWTAVEFMTKTTVGLGATNVATNYRYDVSKSEIYNKLPLYTATEDTPIKAFDIVNDIDDASCYEPITATISHTTRMEFGSGPFIGALGWATGGNAHVTRTAENDVQLYKLKTDELKLNDLYNYYMYNDFGIYAKNTDIYWPLVSTSKNCEISFTLKPNTTAGTLYMYNNVSGSQDLTAQNFTANGDTAATSKSLSVGTTYTIKANIIGVKNIVLKWVPSTNTAGGNSFTTSQTVDIKFEN